MGGREWHLKTSRGPVIVWAPEGALEGIVVYVHGYGDTAESAWAKHGLKRQFEASGRRSLFVVPGAPSSRSEAVTWPSLSALLNEVVAGTGLAAGGNVTAVAHSAGFETVASWLADRRLTEVILLDALYGFVRAFGDWAATPGHRFVNIVAAAGKPRTLSDPLMPELGAKPKVGLPTSAPMARVTYFVTALGHMELVTSGLVLPVLLRRGGFPLATLIISGAAAFLVWKLIG